MHLIIEYRESRGKPCERKQDSVETKIFKTKALSARTVRDAFKTLRRFCGEHLITRDIPTEPPLQLASKSGDLDLA